jgi:EAL domain-containing protein (putative c-di-GMP-specific phosphodiesterase class I)
MHRFIRSYHESLPALSEELVNNGCLSLILFDISPFSAVEEEYGIQAYTMVRQRLFALLVEQSGKDFRKEDILALEEPGGLRILLFLSPHRQPAAISYKSLETLRLRLANTLIPKLLRTATPYLKNPPDIPLGISLALHNPLIDPQHTILRSIREALDHARWKRQMDEMNSLQQLHELILNEEVITLFQPIADLRDKKSIGYEALSRGNAGTIFQTADALFESAIKFHLLVELDRVCRKRALLLSNRLPESSKVFINTLPATIRDPEFQGKHLINSLERANLSPERIVIEITERLVIDNLSLFEDALTYFTDLGMSLAVDDVGSGYSGLETIARLKPSYLKVDKSLVHDVHTNRINREMLKAIIGLGRGIGAKVIAEGIQATEELDTLRSIGVDYGQGYLIGRPESTPS